MRESPLRITTLRIIRSVLSFVLGFVAIQLTLTAAVLTVGRRWMVLGIPTDPVGQWVLFALEFVAGVVGAWVMTLIAGWRRKEHAVAFAAIVTVLNTWVVASADSPWPLWLGVAVVITVPLQTWIGYRLAGRTWKRPAQPGTP